MPRKNPTAKGNKLTARSLVQEVFKLFKRTPQKQYDSKQISNELNVGNNRDSVEHALNTLAQRKKVIIAPDRETFKLNAEESPKSAAKPNSKSKPAPEKPQPTPEKRDANKSRKGRKKSTPKASGEAAPPAQPAAEAQKQSGASGKSSRSSKPGKRPSNKKKPAQGNSQGLEATGVVDMTKSGAAFIVCEGLDQDIYVQAKNLNMALDGDTVRVAYTQTPGRRRAEGQVLEVLERSTMYFIGTLNISGKYGFVIPDKHNMFMDIFVPLEEVNGAKSGDKVVVKVVKWPTSNRKSPVGQITETLGRPGTSDVEMKAILISNGFELSFPKEVIAESESLTDHLTPEELARRRDMRPVTTFTIDPLTAKDFDDALSIQYLDNGNIEVGVHIADVTHYVKPGTALDLEAYNRSTSVYLVDRVLPMLPERLSNELCSLRPHEDKFTFSAVFEINKKGRVVSEWFGKTLIHSNRRFTYEEAQERIETQEGDFAKEINDLNRIAYQLREQRYAEGSISFESPEVRFKLDENAVPIELYVKTRKDAHMLVEDFMLLANKRVAMYVGKPHPNLARIPFVYRVHDEPDMGKVADFANFAGAFGVKIQVNTPAEVAKAFNDLQRIAQEKPELSMLAPLAIRTMAKAEYSTNNIGHYGLGFEYYTHFTSPIRRYSDVLVHRLLYDNLDLDRPKRADEKALSDQCLHISRQERKATDAERQSIKYKQVEYMQNHIGSEFKGVINGFSDRGMFIEMPETLCEGMVAFETMDDNYTLDETRLVAIGKRTGRRLKIGDVIRVIVAGTNLQKRQIDLQAVEE